MKNEIIKGSQGPPEAAESKTEDDREKEDQVAPASRRSVLASRQNNFVVFAFSRPFRWRQFSRSAQSNQCSWSSCRENICKYHIMNNLHPKSSQSRSRGRILTLFLIGGPKLVPMMVSSSLIKCGQMMEASFSPELSGTLEPALLLPTR